MLSPGGSSKGDPHQERRREKDHSESWGLASGIKEQKMGKDGSLSCLFWKSDGGKERKPLKKHFLPEHKQAFCMDCEPPRDGH